MGALRLEVKKTDIIEPYVMFIVLSVKAGQCVDDDSPDEIRLVEKSTHESFTQELHVGVDEREISRHYKPPYMRASRLLPTITTMARRLDPEILDCPEWPHVCQAVEEAGYIDLELSFELTDASLELLKLSC